VRPPKKLERESKKGGPEKEEKKKAAPENGHDVCFSE
jgi:hypothetical protein